MTNFDERKHPRNGDKNIPGHAGRFTENARNHADSDAGLGGGEALGSGRPARGSAYLNALMRDFEVNEEFPFPQANDLEKVILVVDAVENEANTNEALSVAFDVSDSQGAYYGGAAGYLGLVDVAPGYDDTLRVYMLTARGQAMRDLNREERVELMSRIVMKVPAVQTYVDEGGKAVKKELEYDGRLSDTTSKRRSDCIGSWANSVLNREQLNSRVDLETINCESRFPGAAIAASIQRTDARKKAELHKPRVGVICPNCFTQMSLTGACDNCD